MITDFSSRISSKQKLTNIKSDLINNISQNKVWQNLVVNADKAHPTLPGIKINSDLLCLKNRTSCNVGTYDLTLIDMNGSLLTDPNSATKGFDKNGVACNSYGTDPECSFRFSLNWTAICPASDASCLNPQIKVKIMATSSNQIYANTKTLSPFELLVNTDKESDPVIKKAVVITNSSHYYPSEAPVKFDPSGYIFSENKINFTIGIPEDSPNSVNGGTLSAGSNIIGYTPAANFYGFDQFQYTVTNPINGKTYLASAWVWVMTPYTWTGLGSNSDTSTLKNFCGKVKNGACDATTFPANDKHYIFNASCTNCNANLNSSPNSLEMSKDFNGSVNLASNISFTDMGSVVWQKYPVFNQKSGVFDGKTGNVLAIRLTSKWGYAYTTNDWSFVLEGGNFKAPSILRVSGPVDIKPTATFNHNNGLVNLFQVYQTNILVQAPNVNFYDLQFDNLDPLYDGFSTHYQFQVNKNFTVNNDIIFSVRGPDNTIAGNSSTTISVKGNVIVRGAGGTGSDSPYLSLDGTGIQTITGVTPPAVLPNPNSNGAQPDYVGKLIPFIPKVRINKTQGKVILNGWIGYKGFEVLSEPDQGIDVTNTTFVVGGIYGGTGNEESPFMPGNLHLKDVFFMPSSHVKFLSPNIYIDGNMYHYLIGYAHLYYDSLSIPSSTIHLLGDLYIDGGFDHDRLDRAVTVNMIGANPAKIFGSATSVAQTHININKSAGVNVGMQGGFGTACNLTLTSGNLSLEPNMLVRIPKHGWNTYTSTFNTPGVQFHNMSIDHGFRASSDIFLDGDLSIGTNGGGNYSLSLGGTGVFMLQGNLNLGSGLPYGGGQKIQLTGVNDSSINFTANPLTQKNLGTTDFIINKETASTKVFYNPGNVKINNLLVSRGTLEMITTSTIQAASASSAAGTSIINKNCNTISASTTNFNGVVNPGSCGGWM